MTVIAKPIVDKQFWILKQDDEKVGNVQAVSNGYRLTLNNTVIEYKTIRMLRKQTNIEFVDAETSSKPDTHQVNGYQTGCKAYNPIWNVQMHLPLFTKQNKSKSWFAAGWYRVKQHSTWKVTRNPKLITLQRYKYVGPFHTEEQARDQSIS